MKKPEEVKTFDRKKRLSVRVNELLILDDKELKEKLLSILTEMYDKKIEVNEKYILKCVSLAFRKKDSVIYLPYNLQVEKEKDTITFSFVKKNPNKLIWIWMISLFFFIAMTSTFAAITILSRSHLNKDIDGDGIADINLDLNNDGICEINCDTNNDDKPDINIDYNRNLKAMFNIDTDGDGIPDYNLINQLDENGICVLNCDTNGDGWPDLNIDLYGEGRCTLMCDTDGDGLPNLNIDTNGDGVCDLMCDTDGDGICDKFCYKNDTDKDEEHRPGNTTVIGDPNNDMSAVAILINFVDKAEIFVQDLFPEDQSEFTGIIGGITTKVPDKVFTVENVSSYSVKYSLKFNIKTNDYISNNFVYSVNSTNGGGTLSLTTAPKETTTFIKDIIIPPKVTQKYTVSFKLKSTGGPQNYDQGKTFEGYISIDF